MDRKEKAAVRRILNEIRSELELSFVNPRTHFHMERAKTKIQVLRDAVVGFGYDPDYPVCMSDEELRLHPELLDEPKKE